MVDSNNKGVPLWQQRIDHDILQNGDLVVWSHTLPSTDIEEWVKKVAQRSGSPIDWAWH